MADTISAFTKRTLDSLEKCIRQFCSIIHSGQHVYDMLHICSLFEAVNSGETTFTTSSLKQEIITLTSNLEDAVRTAGLNKQLISTLLAVLSKLREHGHLKERLSTDKLDRCLNELFSSSFHVALLYPVILELGIDFDSPEAKKFLSLVEVLEHECFALFPLYEEILQYFDLPAHSKSQTPFPAKRFDPKTRFIQ